MPAIIDLTGKKFNRLVVMKRGVSKTKKIKWVCKCICGVKKTIDGNHLKSGAIKSCGCLKKEANKKIGIKSFTHGKTKTKEYYIWGSMIQRCTNQKNKNYKDYGGRGITVHKDWLSFKTFFADMGEKPENHQIERINNNLGYSKNNCKWATKKENSQNSRTSKLWVIDKLQFNSLSEAAKHFDVDNKTISRWCNGKKQGCYCRKKY
jgi:hypothetical protein